MDACINKGIIERTPGPSGVMVRDTKRVFSELWKKSPKVINCLNVLKKKEIECFILSSASVIEIFLYSSKLSCKSNRKFFK